MKNAEDILNKIARAKYITTLDRVKSFWQMSLERSAREHTTFSTPFSLFQYKTMPFGTINSSATFQRLADKLLVGCEHFACAYIDDIVIFSDNFEDHVKNVDTVLNRIMNAKLTIKASKCQMGCAQVLNLGHVVGQGKLMPNPLKVKDIKEYDRPKTKKQVRAYLGLTGYYSSFIKNYADLASPLTSLLKKNLPNEVRWTDECENLFRNLKQALISAPILTGLDMTKQFELQCDASETGLGAVLSQRDKWEMTTLLYT